MINETVNLLGFRAEDTVTGYSGVVSSVTFDLFGVVQAHISPPLNEKGEIGDDHWFDVQRLKITDEQRVMEAPPFDAHGLIARMGYPGACKLSGYDGIVTAVALDLYGCAHLAITPKVDEDGKLKRSTWFLEPRIAVDTSGARVMEPPAFDVNKADPSAEVKPADWTKGPADLAPPRA